MPIPSDATVAVTRFDLYPADEPTARVVGVTLTLPNGRDTYQDTQVALSDTEGLTNEEVRDLGISQMENALTSWAEANADAPGFVGDEEAWQDVEDRLIPQWSADAVVYAVGDQVRYEGSVYECLQAHTSQQTWNPQDAVSLWTEIS